MNGQGVPARPSKPMLLSNLPNPFNPSTAIRFMVPDGSGMDFQLVIHDAAGRVVSRLATGHANPGLNQIIWNGTDDRGASVGSGVYFYRLELGGERLVSRMVLVK